jgi:hypothetical protein
MKILIVTILAFVCNSCVESITYHGKYADYKITPKKPIVTEDK